MPFRIRHIVKQLWILLALIMLFDVNHAQASDAKFSLEKIESLLWGQGESFDLGMMKLEIDQMVDPTINIETTRSALDQMVDSLKSMIHPNATPSEIMSLLKKFLYEPGPWNQGKIFQYDLSDPMGTRISNKIMGNYLKTRKGNCVSMPILVVILAQRLGVDATLAMAPEHILVKFRHESGDLINMEATNGGHRMRNEWYIHKMNISDSAVQNGIYLRKLTHRETRGLIASLLLEQLMQQQRFEEIIAVAGVILKAYPSSVQAMLLAGSAYGVLLDREFLQKYADVKEIPSELIPRLRRLRAYNTGFFNKAESLGWRPSPLGSDEKYLKSMVKLRKGLVK